MSEQLLTPGQAAKKLAISRSTFYRLRAGLIARGVRTIKVGSGTKYLESSMDEVIRRAAENETAVC
ncbi:MAG: helix-turn-helix domain-containing protein [Phycisphaerae bacterium]|nr:helix-turn-helix domain-containing protein [Phycisphaerae bacterium]